MEGLDGVEGLVAAEDGLPTEDRLTAEVGLTAEELVATGFEGMTAAEELDMTESSN